MTAVMNCHARDSSPGESSSAFARRARDLWPVNHRLRSCFPWCGDARSHIEALLSFCALLIDGPPGIRIAENATLPCIPSHAASAAQPGACTSAPRTTGGRMKNAARARSRLGLGFPWSHAQAHSTSRICICRFVCSFPSSLTSRPHGCRPHALAAAVAMARTCLFGGPEGTVTHAHARA